MPLSTDTDRSASYLDLHLEIDSEGGLRTKLYFFFWPLCCLFFFDIQILITPLVSSNSSFSTIFAIHPGVQFYWWMKSGVPEENHSPVASY